MGRKPIGKRAMTAAERQRRYRARRCPTAEECDEDEQKAMYAMARDLLERMTDATRDRLLAHVDRRFRNIGAAVTKANDTNGWTPTEIAFAAEVERSGDAEARLSFAATQVIDLRKELAAAQRKIAKLKRTAAAGK